MNESLAKLPLERPEDVFALRQSGRVAAARIGYDEADQVRFATALSELGREALLHGAGALATFVLQGDGSLNVDISNFPRSAGHIDRTLVGILAARKLVDDVTIVDDNDVSVVRVTLRRKVQKPTSSGALRLELGRVAAPRPLDELRLENRDLIATLSELKLQQDELVRLNAELEETNKGVMAMYGQLADELEETNRGVVALYAELDDKTVQLKAASEAKTRFLASVSHELRSPVNSILALVQLLSEPDGAALTESQEKQLSLVRSSGRELLNLVNQLLDLAKAESGRLQPEAAPVDVPTLLSELRGSLRPLVRPGVRLEFDVPPLPVAHTDGVLLNQVLRNLLTNALKFTERGRVRLSASLPTTHELEVSVSDTGIGIAEDDRAKIFEEFYQVRGPLQAAHKGTGLGLPYARRVAETLGGTLSCSSRLGEGSTFTVRIPLQWQPLLRASASPGPAPARTTGIGTILLVDDDESLRTSLRGQLQGLAARIIEAKGGAEGLELMRSDAPDLAFVDWRMPDIDGAAVIAQMQADPALRKIPTIVVTSAELDLSLSGSLGAITVLAKSNVNRAALEAVVEKAMQGAVNLS